MSKKEFPNKILWLASYPKSGNTWFRAFLSALLNDKGVNINEIDTDGIFSSRAIFENITDIDSRDLYDEEVKNMLPDVFNTLANGIDRLSIIKVHDAVAANNNGEKIIPADVTLCAVYIVRNPLDIVASLANHNNTSIDDAVKFMNNKNGSFGNTRINLNTNSQLNQFMGDWSHHVLSWTRETSFPVHVLRYEDMLANPFDTFSSVLKKIGWDFPDIIIRKAIEATEFNTLKQQEKEHGFLEKNVLSESFFRQGKAGNWGRELNMAQIESIKKNHSSVMNEFGYL